MTDPIYPNSESIFCIVEITPYFGYEVVFSGSPYETLLEARKSIPDIELYQVTRKSDDMFLLVTSKLLADTVHNHFTTKENE